METQTKIALSAVVALAFIIFVVIICIVKQKRAEAIRDSKYATDLPPPVHTVMMATSMLQTQKRDPRQSHDLESQTSEMSDIDLWELRQKQRREYVVDRLITKTVQLKLCSGLDLPHVRELSSRCPDMSMKHRPFDNPNKSQNTTTILDYSQSLDKNLDQMQSNKTSFVSDTSLSTNHSTPSHSTPGLGASHNAYSHDICPICLEGYQNEDEVCWSRNTLCAHAYHLKCMTGWLMNTDKCLLCGCNYLKKVR